MKFMKPTHFAKKVRLGIAAVAVLVFGGQFSASAQEMSADNAAQGLYQENTFNFGAKGGLTLSYYGDNLVRLGNDVKKGLAGGGYVQYNMKTWLSFRGEVWFMQSGHANMANQYAASRVYNGYIESDLLPTFPQANGVIVSSSTNSNITLNMIDVPLQVVVRPPVLNFTRLYPSIYLGYSLGFILDARDERLETFYLAQSGSDLASISSRASRRDVTSDYQVVDQGVNMGFGFTYPTNKSYNFVFDFRYRMGLSQIGRNSRLKTFDGDNITDPTVDGILAPRVTDLNTNTLFFSVGIEF
jgi:hypothetical protein